MAKVLKFAAAPQSEARGMIDFQQSNHGLANPEALGFIGGMTDFFYGSAQGAAGKAHVQVVVKKADGATVLNVNAPIAEANACLNVMVNGNPTSYEVNTSKKVLGTLNIDELGASGTIEVTVSGNIQSGTAIIGNVSQATGLTAYNNFVARLGAQINLAGNGHFSTKMNWYVEEV